MSERTSIWNNPRRGFRMMWWDPIAMLLCGAAVWAGWDVLGPWTLIAPYVLGTFFLFCNVFRVRRNAELVWAVSFLVNAVAWLQVAPSLVGIVVTQSVLTAVVIACEVRSPGYRGILSGPAVRQGTA